MPFRVSLPSSRDNFKWLEKSVVCMNENRSRNKTTETPDVDTREYGVDSVTFYEVGESEAWMEVSEDVLISEENWR